MGIKVEEDRISSEGSSTVELEEKSSEEQNLLNPTNPFIIAYQGLTYLHNQALLPIVALGLVNIYNIVVFRTEAGKELYTLVPLIMLVFAYLTTYWKTLEEEYNIYRILAGFTLVSFALLIDLIVSVSYIPSTSVRGFDLESLPTLILDLVAIGSLVFWINQNKQPLLIKLGRDVNPIVEDQPNKKLANHVFAKPLETQDEVTDDEQLDPIHEK